MRRYWVHKKTRQTDIQTKDLTGRKGLDLRSYLGVWNAESLGKTQFTGRETWLQGRERSTVNLHGRKSQTSQNWLPETPPAGFIWNQTYCRCRPQTDSVYAELYAHGIRVVLYSLVQIWNNNYICNVSLIKSDFGLTMFTTVDGQKPACCCRVKADYNPVCTQFIFRWDTAPCTETNGKYIKGIC